MKLLVLSRMFPSERHATSAIFLAKFLMHLQPHLERLLVVSPQVYVPWVLSFRKRWAVHRNVTRHGTWNGIEVVRPSALYLKPIWYRARAGQMIAWNTWPTVKRFHQQIGFDAVLGFSVLPDGAVAMHLGRRLGIPSLAWSIGSDLNVFPNEAPALRKAAREVLEAASLVLANSNSLRDRALEITPTIRRIETFSRGIDLAIFSIDQDRAALRAELGLPSEGQLLVNVGRLSVAKGIEEVLTVFGRLKDRTAKLHLALAGENTLGSRLDELIRGTGASDRVFNLGMLSHDKVASLLRAGDVMLFASHHEGLPNVPVEAMAAGTPVISTRVGGVPEFVTDDENGLLVEIGDVDAMTAAVERILDDADLRDRLIEAGRRTATERFDASKNAVTFVQMLRDVVGAANESK